MKSHYVPNIIYHVFFLYENGNQYILTAEYIYHHVYILSKINTIHSGSPRAEGVWFVSRYPKV